MTDAPRRIQLSRAHGWRMPENTVKVDRTTGYGNPFKVGLVACNCRSVGERLSVSECSHNAFRCESAKEVVAVYRQMHRSPRRLQQIRDELGGKNLACWCKIGEPCHTDVLLELANAPEGA